MLVRQRNFAIEFVPAGAPGLHRRGLNRGAFRCATEDVPDLVGGGCREENRVALEARRGLHGKAGFEQHDDAIVCCEDHVLIVFYRADTLEEDVRIDQRKALRSIRSEHLDGV